MCMRIFAGTAILGLIALLAACGPAEPVRPTMARPVRPTTARPVPRPVKVRRPTPVRPVSPVVPGRVAYITIDDGPSPVYTPEVLRILRREGVPATFFLVGTRILAAPDVAREIYADGDAVGNHSYDHVYAHLYRSPLGFYREVELNQEIIRRVVGVRATLFRAPGGTVGNFRPIDYVILKRLGLHLVGWNVDAGDAVRPRPSPAAIVARVVHQLRRRPYLWSHAIILLHDFDPQTVRALPGIIDWLKRNGFQFAKVTTDTPPAW